MKNSLNNQVYLYDHLILSNGFHFFDTLDWLASLDIVYKIPVWDGSFCYAIVER